MRDFRRFVKGVTFKPNDGGSNPIGDLSGVLTAADNGSVYHYQNRLKAFLDAVEREIITNDQAQTITNKTIDADNNTISNIENDNIKAGAAIEESKLALDHSTASLNTAITDHIADTVDAHDASAVSFNNVSSGLTATEVQGAIDEVEARLQTAETDISNHIADTVDAHDASAISSVPSGNLAATDVQGALNELQSDIDTRALASDLSNHLSDTTDAHDASAISFDNVASGLAATEVQGAIDELDGRLDDVETAAGDAQTDIDNHIADTTDAHDASAISNVPAGNLAATDVQGALNELQSDIDTRALASDLTTHISDTEAHGATGAVVGTTNTQTLTNKTLDGASIESPTRLDVKKDTKANLETYATTATDGQLCFATDEKVMYQVVDNALTEVGAGGGVGSVDIMFADTFNSTAIAEYTTTGTVALTESALEVLQGKKSLKITHTGGASAERIIPVDIKFRNKNVTMSFDVESDAASGNLTLTVIDNTNTVTLINAESIQPQEALQTSVKRSVSFTIPDDCEELKYKFTAVSESGKISIIDNIVIELTQTAKMSTTIEAPIVTEWQDYALTIGATTTAPTKGTTSVDKAQWRRVGQDMEIRYDYKQTGAGTAGSGTYLFPIPAGYTVDTAKVPMGTAEQAVVGVAKVSNTTSSTGSTTAHGVVLLSKTYPNNFNINYTQTGETTANVASGAYPLNSGTIGFSFTAKVPIVGWSATETQEVSLAQAVLKQESDSAIQLDNANGYGSATDNRIARFSTQRLSIGDAITYQDDPVNGARFTVTKSGIYTINFNAAYTANTGSWHGISKNASSLTTVISSLPMSEVLSLNLINDADVATNQTTASWSGYLQAGDIIRPHTSRQTQQLVDKWTFSMSYQGSLKQVNVTENQKIAIPTSELRMEGASTRGTGSDSAIVRFDNIAKLRGDAFEVVSNATVGTVITMKKKGKLSISCNLVISNATAAISINQSVRTNLPTISSEVLAIHGEIDSGTSQNFSTSAFVNVGDVIRVSANQTPTSNISNNINLSFQEQEVAVSVTNVLPQFSDSDTYFRAQGFNTLASTTTRGVRLSSVTASIGSAVTYTDDAAFGATYTINEDGMYDVSAIIRRNGGVEYAECYVTVNETANLDLGATATPSSVIARASAASNTQDITANTAAAQVYLLKDDKVRVQIRRFTGSSVVDVFTISKVGKPNVTGVDVTPFAAIEYEVTDAASIIGNNNGAASTWTVFRRFTGLTSFSNKGVIKYVQDSVFGDYFEALKKCSVNVNWSGPYNSAGVSSTFITKNPLSNSGTSGDVIAFSDSGTNLWNSISGSTVLNIGDKIRFASNAANTFTTTALNITATELRDAYQVIGGGVENTYSARITSAGAITSQSYPFIASITKGGTGIYTLNLVPGFFTVAPNAVATNASSSISSTDRVAQVTSSTTTSIGIITNGNGTLLDYDFNIMVQRQGSDYRTPSKAIGLPQQRIAVLNHELAPTVGSGASTTGVWVTQNLSNIKSDTTGIVKSLAANVVTLPAGRYRVQASQNFYGTADSLIRLHNTTDASTLVTGIAAATAPTANDFTTAVLDGVFTLTAEKQIALQYRVQQAGGTYSRGGLASNFGENVVTTSVTFTRLEE